MTIYLLIYFLVYQLRMSTEGNHDTPLNDALFYSLKENSNNNTPLHKLAIQSVDNDNYKKHRLKGTHNSTKQTNDRLRCKIVFNRIHVILLSLILFVLWFRSYNYLTNTKKYDINNFFFPKIHSNLVVEPLSSFKRSISSNQLIDPRENQQKNNEDLTVIYFKYI